MKTATATTMSPQDVLALLTKHGITLALAHDAFALQPTKRDRTDAIKRARAQYQNEDVEIDKNASLSESDCGTWVQAWVWIYDEIKDDDE